MKGLGPPELWRLLGEDASELAPLIPTLRRNDGSIAEVPPNELTPSSQLRLFEALLGLLGRLACIS